MKFSHLPYAHLDTVSFSRRHGDHAADLFSVLTDEELYKSCGVRLAFTDRHGGVSEGVYRKLNLSEYVGDNQEAVSENRIRILDALGGHDLPLLAAKQVHGTDLITIDDACAETIERARQRGRAGADGFIVRTADVGALICIADCVPVAIVSPSGAFSLVHSGWRGVVASIASGAAYALAKCETEQSNPYFQTEADALDSYNVYIGPYIHGECFEVEPDVYKQLVDLGGSACALDERHVDLGRVVVSDLIRQGINPKRIADAGICTACHPEEYYSYRASDGVCGRQGVIAFRKA